MAKVREEIESQSCYLLLWVIATHNVRCTVICVVLHALMSALKTYITLVQTYHTSRAPLARDLIS